MKIDRLKFTTDQFDIIGNNNYHVMMQPGALTVGVNPMRWQSTG